MEQNKVLMVIVSVAIFFTAVIGVGVALLYPRAESDAAGEVSGSVQEFDPIEYIRRPETAPITPSEDGEEPAIIVYGSEEPSAEGVETPLETVAKPGPGESTITERPAVSTRPAVSESPDADSADRAARTETTTAPVQRESVAATRTAAPHATPREVRVTEYWIQLIASPSRDRVEQANSVLGDYSLAGRITTRDVDGTLYYRLRVGPYPNAEEADKFLEWITEIDGFQGAYVSEEYPLRTVNG